MGRLTRFPGFGSRVRERLDVVKKPGETDRAWAERHGYRQQQVSRYITGSTPEQFAVLERLAMDLGIPVAWLLLGDRAITELRAWEMRQAPATVKRERRMTELKRVEGGKT